jgi:hypothetical protein
MKIPTILALTLALATYSNAAPFSKRRFGQEHSSFVEPLYQKMRDAAAGTDFASPVGQMSGEAVNALLAAKPACRQQNVADTLVFFAKKMGADTTITDGKQKEKDLIDIAKQYRTAERNTNQDGKPSLLCGKDPLFSELNGIEQEQDPQATTKPDKPTDATNLDNNFDPVGVLAEMNQLANNGGPPKTTDPEDDPKETNPPKTDPKDDPKETNPPKTDPKDDPKETNPPKTDPKDPTTGTNEAETNPLGGVKMPKIIQANGEIRVNQFKFNDLASAHDRQCAIQNNLCANSFNLDKNPEIESVAACNQQQQTCNAGPPVIA